MSVSSLANTAYGANSVSARTERGTEHAAFETITARLIKARQPTASMALRAAALHDNRRLWTTLAVDLATPQNELPQGLRAQLFYLAEFSLLQSGKALEDVAALDALIDINRSVMRGLMGSMEAA